MEQFSNREELAAGSLSFSMGLEGGEASPFSDKFRSEQILLGSEREEGDRDGTELDLGRFLLFGTGVAKDLACICLIHSDAAAARNVPFRGGDKVEAALVAWCITDRLKDLRCLDENFGVGHFAWTFETKPPGNSGGMGCWGAAGVKELGGGIIS